MKSPRFRARYTPPVSERSPRKPGLRGGGKPGRSRADGRSHADRRARPGGPGRPPGGGRPRATDPAREVVFHSIARQARLWPDLDIEGLPDEATCRLSPLDDAFAHALYDAVVRRWITLRYLLSIPLKVDFEKIEPRTAAALLCGAAQILFLTRVPVHAAVNESVNWVKSVAGVRAGGMTNAVLRRVGALVAPGDASRRPRWNDGRDELPLGDGSALALAEPVLPEDPLARLAVATSHPIDLLRGLSRSMALRDVRRAALHGLVSPPVILNTAYAAAPLPAEAVPHAAPGHHVFTGPYAALRAVLDARRDLWVQDPASSLAVESVADLKPSLVIDACAGLGTKTRQLAAAFPEAEIVATDVDLPRRRTLERVFAGHPRVRIIEHAALIDRAGMADLVLLDVPCSNTGVLARRVEARYRFSPERTGELISAQRQIIADALRLLKTGRERGRILYSTCSLDPRENEEQARWAVRWHSFSVSRENRRLPEGVPGEGAEKYSDGSYAVLLE